MRRRNGDAKEFKRLLALAMAVATVLLVTTAIAPAQAQTNSSTGRGSWVYQPSWPLTSTYTISWDFSSVAKTDASQVATVTLFVKSLIGQTEGVQTQRINVTIYNDQGIYYSQSFSQQLHLSQGDFWGPVQFPVTLSSSTIGLGPQQSASLTVKITVQFQELAWPSGSPYSKTANVPQFQISVMNPTPVPAAPDQQTSQARGFTASTIIVFSLFVFAMSGIVRRALALPRKGAGGRLYDPATGQFVSIWTAMKAFGSFALGFVVVGMSQFSGLLANFVGLAGGDVFGSGDLQAALGLFYLVIGLVGSR